MAKGIARRVGHTHRRHHSAQDAEWAKLKGGSNKSTSAGKAVVAAASTDEADLKGGEPKTTSATRTGNSKDHAKGQTGNKCWTCGKANAIRGHPGCVPRGNKASATKPLVATTDTESAADDPVPTASAPPATSTATGSSQAPPSLKAVAGASDLYTIDTVGCKSPLAHSISAVLTDLDLPRLPAEGQGKRRLRRGKGRGDDMAPQPDNALVAAVAKPKHETHWPCADNRVAPKVDRRRVGVRSPLRIWVEIDGHRALALLDTGASCLAVSSQFAKAHKLRRI